MYTKTRCVAIVAFLVFAGTLSGTLFAQELRVKKVACGEYSTSWTWNITKTADKGCPAGVVSEGQTLTANYTVTLTPTGADAWSVGGVCTTGERSRFVIRNATSVPVAVTGISDYLTFGSEQHSAPFTCTYAGNPIELPTPSSPFNLPAGDVTIQCSFSSSGTGTRPTTNTAQATTASATYTDTVDIVYTQNDSTDECVNVTDQVGSGVPSSLGTVCQNSTVKSLQYSRNIGPLSCGDFSVPNTARFDTNDTHATGSSSWEVCGSVACENGCTLTPGYWKTHSSYGPAPYDDTWAMLPQGADTPFFLSGQSWYQVFWTSPAGGSAYYILAHAYMAAKLNLLNGADSTTDVNAALSWAESFFNTYTPSSVLSRTVRSEAINKAALLDSYNNGYIGPGHCVE